MSFDPALKVLIADMLTDIGKLHTLVHTLPDTIKDANNGAAQLADRIEQATQQLTQAGNLHQKAIRDYLENVASSRINQVANEAIKREKTEFLAEARSERAETVAAVRAATAVLQTTIVQTQTESLRAHRTNCWLIAGLSLLVGASVATLVLL